MEVGQTNLIPATEFETLLYVANEEQLGSTAYKLLGTAGVSSLKSWTYLFVSFVLVFEIGSTFTGICGPGLISKQGKESSQLWTM